MKVKKAFPQITLRCIARHGLTKIGSLHKATVFPTTGAVNILPWQVTFTAHPILFVRSDGTPENSKAWEAWEIVAPPLNSELAERFTP
jgi:hypothetical protein